MEDLWQRKCFPIDGGRTPDGTPFYSVLRCATEKMDELIAAGVDFDIVVDVPELATAGYLRLHDVLPEAKRRQQQYPRWIHYKLHLLLSGQITFWIGYRITRWLRRRNATKP